VGVSRRPVALSIAGSDSGGGAGIAADLKTFDAFGVWGTAAVVAVTAQNSLGVQASLTLPPSLVRAQILSVTGDIGVDAAKTGMLGTAESVSAVADALEDAAVGRLVVDPVITSKHGDHLLAADAVAVLRRRLLPLATVVTPNLAEAAALTGRCVLERADMVAAAGALADMGPRVVVVTGGHLAGVGSPDLLWSDGSPEWLEGPRVEAVHTHGTGCVFSAAITAGLAAGRSPTDAVTAAKAFVTAAVAGGFALGRGVGPVDPTAATAPAAGRRGQPRR
jgi:hydroxymethylpyrimidine/phosphomethylpyrimidine kinase